MERTVGALPHPEGTRRVLGDLSPEFDPASPAVRRTRHCWAALFESTYGFRVNKVKTVLSIFSVIILIKVLINFQKYFRCKLLFRKYKTYMKNPEWEFLEFQPQIVSLLKDAGIEDSMVTVVQPIGYGNLQSSHVSVFSNISNRRSDVVGMVQGKFHQALGVYRSRIFESVNPLYWIEFFINLPKRLLTYIGVPAESIVIKILQLLYWVIALIVGFVFGIYKPDLELLIKNWINNLP